MEANGPLSFVLSDGASATGRMQPTGKLGHMFDIIPLYWSYSGHKQDKWVSPTMKRNDTIPFGCICDRK